MMLPSRLKLTITVMSMPGLAREAGGGFQQVRNLATTSLMVSTRAGSTCADAIHDGNSSDAAKQTSPLRSAAITRLSWSLDVGCDLDLHHLVGVCHFAAG